MDDDDCSDDGSLTRLTRVTGPSPMASGGQQRQAGGRPVSGLRAAIAERHREGRPPPARRPWRPPPGRGVRRRGRREQPAPTRPPEPSTRLGGGDAGGRRDALERGDLLLVGQPAVEAGVVAEDRRRRTVVGETCLDALPAWRAAPRSKGSSTFTISWSWSLTISSTVSSHDCASVSTIAATSASVRRYCSWRFFGGVGPEEVAVRVGTVELDDEEVGTARSWRRTTSGTVTTSSR